MKSTKKIEATKKIEDSSMDRIADLIAEAMAKRAWTSDKGNKAIGNASRETGNIFREILGDACRDLAEKLLPYTEQGREICTMRPFLLGCIEGLQTKAPNILKETLKRNLTDKEQENERLKAELAELKAALKKA